MKNIIRSLVLLIVFAALFGWVPANAKTQTMTDAHIERIATNCPLVLGTLGRIHANDAPRYINSNQTYFSISDKLMAHLNSRLTLNRYNAAELVQTASDFNTALGKFRTAYKTYDNTMADLIRMDCKRVPVSFYDTVAAAREQRKKVHDTVVELHKLIDQYRDNVREFKKLHFSDKAGKDNE